jgi:hypothetical protein
LAKALLKYFGAISRCVGFRRTLLETAPIQVPLSQQFGLEVNDYLGRMAWSDLRTSQIGNRDLSAGMTTGDVDEKENCIGMGREPSSRLGWNPTLAHKTRKDGAPGCGGTRSARGLTSDYLAMPIEYVPVHSQSAEPSALTFPAQPPEPLMPLSFPVPLAIFHLLAAGFVISVEEVPS